MTPYYDDGTVAIYHADIRYVSDLGGVDVACTFTSPPYNVGLGYDASDDALPWGEYKTLANACCGLASQALIPGGRAWVNVAPVVPADPGAPGGEHSGRMGKQRLGLLRFWWDCLLEWGLDVWDVVAWASPRGPATAWGSWASPAAPNLRGNWEAILFAYKPPFARDLSGGPKDEHGDWASLCTNVWTDRTAGRRGGEHPAPFPLSLPSKAIRLSSQPGETIFDPFAGTGTTLRAAKDLGRRAIGVEISEKYCEIAALRCAQEVLPL